LIYFNAGDPFVRGHIARALYDRLHVNGGNRLVLPKGFHINCPVIGHTTISRMAQETEKSTAVTMSWFRGAPRVDVIDGTAGHLLDGHVYVSLYIVFISLNQAVKNNYFFPRVQKIINVKRDRIIFCERLSAVCQQQTKQKCTNYICNNDN